METVIFVSVGDHRLLLQVERRTMFRDRKFVIKSEVILQLTRERRCKF